VSSLSQECTNLKCKAAATLEGNIVSWFCGNTV